MTRWTARTVSGTGMGLLLAGLALAPLEAAGQEACVISTRGLTGEQPKGFSVRLVSSADATCRLDRVVVDVGAGHTLATTSGLTCLPTTWTFSGLGTSQVTMTAPPGQGLAVGGGLSLCVVDDLGAYWDSGQTVSVRLACDDGTQEPSAPYSLFYESCSYKCASISEARLGSCPPVPGTLRIETNLLPADDPGRFDLLLDGAVVASGLGDGGAAVQVVSPGEHEVAERAAAGTALADYTRVFGGDCDPAGKVSISAGETRTCTVTNLRAPRLVVRKILVPPNGRGRFDLLVDGRAAAKRVGNGGTAGPLTLSPGLHWVAELPARQAGPALPRPPPFTNPLMYGTQIGGDCTPDGLVTLAPGQVKTCTLTNRLLPEPAVGPACRRVCERIGAACRAAATRPHGPRRALCDDFHDQCLGACH